MMNKLACEIATCGFVGRSKYAPGTMGSLCGLVLVLIFSGHGAFFILLNLIIFVIGIWASNHAAIAFNQKDPSSVVIDEVIGTMITFILVPIGAWHHFLIGFILFRFFDIVKPKPIRYFERFPGGYGIVFDDVIAGIYSNFLLQILIRYAHI